MIKTLALTNFLDNKYPTVHAFDWDNCGLQVGNKNNSIQKVCVCLTLTTEIAKKAVSEGVQLIITHHPLIFKPIAVIDTSTYYGSILEMLLQNNISVYSLHTNFDVCTYGVSDVLASKYGYTKTKVLSPIQADLYKLTVFVPEESFEPFRTDFLNLSVGDIGNYSHCSFSTGGEGTFLPNQEANPYLGTNGILEKVSEFKIETIVKQTEIDRVIHKMKELHPYEEPAFDIIPLKNGDETIGLGRYLCLDEEKEVFDFMSIIPGYLKGDTNQHKKVNKIGFCGGSGSSLVKKAVALGIDLYVTGDVDYHTAIEAKELGLAVLDIGHEQSEMPAMEYLSGIIFSSFPELEVIVM